MAKQTALVVCPGRGTYNAPELGYLQKHHDGGGDMVAMLDVVEGSLLAQPATDLEALATKVWIMYRPAFPSDHKGSRLTQDVERILKLDE